MVRLAGARKIDHRSPDFVHGAGPHGTDRGRQGFLLNLAQLSDLMEGLRLPRLPGHELECRAWLNRIRDIVLKDCLQTDQQPTRREVHAALAELRKQTLLFLACAATIGPREWRADAAAIAPEGPLNVFCMLPEALYGFAAHARFEARCSAAPLGMQLLAFAEAADGLAQGLKWLDFVAQDKAFKALPQTSDYAVGNLADAVRIAQRLDPALEHALETSKKHGGPEPKRIMKQAVVWLAELLDYYGGTFTHNPRIKTEYKGRPQTPAGQFVFRFLKLCDSSITETAVSQFMAEAIEFRNQQRRLATEETSS
ncbi:hypothetical protein NLM33_17495 [Bradyrhizobium sp. CCGUVB1N3]|uniref:hypothetical protein n=1 Tax=Bradyrhizobium sp. CCGUVB1N3 TaxID=2949629 RepID=UPI0020B1D37A|nr:hypothetical protein [Bradyrhizobium sp. CCGUVB1N3]MCP3472114.1 hypothetical protein [Bradyrhizobium sp. CCGUVB1N3]